VVRHGVSIALACCTFGVSETCYRYSPLLSDENEEIADLLIGLTTARKTWGFGLCFLHLRNVQAIRGTMNAFIPLAGRRLQSNLPRGASAANRS
jgi:hypothetical protein